MKKLGALLLLVGLSLGVPFIAQADKPPTPVKLIDRGLVLSQWRFLPGPLNAITDVTGVAVGHTTIKHDIPVKRRTGVTAILPHAGNLATQAVFAAASVLNGNGEMTGLATIEHTGLLNSPIVLTNTTSVGAAHLGVHAYMRQQYGASAWSGQLPVVAECWDGFFNTIDTPLIPEDTIRALKSANTGPFKQGSVGAGTGMRSFELHAGIGSASRIIMVGNQRFTVGVLVNTNHSRLAAMHPDVRKLLETRLGNLNAKRQQDASDGVRSIPVAPRQGSIIAIIATDAPLLPAQLKQLANRVALGIAAMGSTMDTTSGDFALAFSTAQQIPVNGASPWVSMSPVVHPDAISDLQRATVEAVTEAQMNALIFKP